MSLVRKLKNASSILLCLTTVGHAATNYNQLVGVTDVEDGSDNIKGYIGALSNQANQDVGDVPGNRYRGTFLFDYHKDLTSLSNRGLERRFTLTAEVNDQSLTTYSAPEVYVGGMLTNKDHIRFGRQVLEWSEVDHTWGFGKLNNRINFDAFTPGQEGLIGLLYERKSSNGMRYRAFLSGLYVPETNPPLDIDKSDKTITSRHPWADAPARTAETEPGIRKDIAYNVDYPAISEVVYRYTVGANLGYESKHWVGDLFIVRKPENQMSQEVTVFLDADSDVVEANIKPQFYYHDVYGGTLRYRNKDIQMYVSGIAVRPNTFPDGDPDVVRTTEIKTEKRREDYLGGGISRINDLYGMGINYVARLSPFNRDEEPLAVDPRWNQALNIFVNRKFGRNITLFGDVKYDMLTTDRLVMIRGTYSVTKALQMSVGMNMIGTPSDGRSYWSPYTNNDSVYGGLRYVY